MPPRVVTTFLLARQLLTPLEGIENAALTIQDGVISALGPREGFTIPANARVVDFGDATLTPGLIDIHIHGAAGHDVMDESAEHLAAIGRMLARHGVTSFCPTTVSAPMDQTLRSLESMGNAVKRINGNGSFNAAGALPIGVHLEGPFLSHDCRGVHPPGFLQAPSEDLFNQMWDAAGGSVRVLTIAPELEGALDVIRTASQRGVCVSIGHSNATLPQALDGINAGARHATHTFNAMRRFEHRDPGLLGAVLTDDAVTADIIADGVHVEPHVVDLFLRAKGLDRAVLISDSISATGMPDGTYMLGSLQVEVRGNRCESNGKLAGSVLTLDRAVRNVMQFAHLSFQDSVRLATLNPARVLGIAHRKGVLQVSADADIVVFSPNGEVQQTIVNGVLGA